MFKIQGVRIFGYFGHSFGFILKSNFKLVGRKFFRCFIVVQSFKKFSRVKALRNDLRIYIFPDKNRFTLEKF